MVYLLRYTSKPQCPEPREQVMESRLVLWRNSQYVAQLNGGREGGRERGTGEEGGIEGRREGGRDGKEGR